MNRRLIATSSALIGSSLLLGAIVYVNSWPSPTFRFLEGLEPSSSRSSQEEFRFSLRGTTKAEAVSLTYLVPMSARAVLSTCEGEIKTEMWRISATHLPYQILTPTFSVAIRGLGVEQSEVTVTRYIPSSLWDKARIRLMLLQKK